MRIELPTLAAVAQWLEDHGHLEGVRVSNLDLTEISERIAATSTEGSAFFGCELGQAGPDILEAGGLVFPPLPHLPYRPYRSELYTPDELMHGYIQGDPGSFLHDTVDSAIYEHFTALRYSEGPVPLLDTLAQRIHDHAMDIALKEVLDNEGSPLKVVGIMGGHAMQRDEPRFGEVAHMARQLAERGYTVATGGGPGAMEAGNLGAWMSRYSASELDEALAILATVASWKEPGWFDTALRVRERWSDGAPSIGIPTWFYGHEPTNLFAAWVAKYFENSVREDGLLAIALHGVIFAPGSAGTIQEVFQDATQNHYGTFGWASPMVFLDTRFWTETKPVHPLLSKLAEGKVYGELIACLDRVEDIVRFIVEHPPRRLR